MFEIYKKAPISRLPEETLLVIFEELAVRPFSNVSNLIGQLGNAIADFQWSSIVLSHVCRYWRQVALQYPKLWSCITQFYQKDALQVYLSRSLGVPLSVFYLHSLMRSCNIQLLKYTLSQLYRIRILGIYNMLYDRFVEYDWTITIGSVLKNPAPLLEQMYVAIRHHNESQFLLWDSVHWEDVFGGYSPRLSFLSVDLDLFRSDKRGLFSVAKGLSQLRLDHSPLQRRFRLEISDVLGVLAQCPGLIEIQLRAVISFSEDPAYDSRSIDLSVLESFSISDITFSVCQQLLASINFPTTTLWSIACSEYPINVLSPTRFAPGLAQSANDAECYALAISTSKLLSSYETEFTARLNGFYGPGYVLKLVSDRSGVADTSVRMGEVARIFQQTFRVHTTRIMLVFDRGIFEDEPPISEDYWRSFFDLIPDVQNLSVRFPRYSKCAKTTQNLLSAMMTTSSGADAEMDVHHKLPHLKDVVLRYSNVPDGLTHPIENPIELAFELARCLQNRRESGLNLASLKVAISDQKSFSGDIIDITKLNMPARKLVWEPFKDEGSFWFF